MCSNVATNLTNENQDLNKESKNCIHLIKEKKLYKMYLKINSQIKTKQQIIFIEKKIRFVVSKHGKKLYAKYTRVLQKNIEKL